MRSIDSGIEHHLASLHELELKLKPSGFVISSNWDYDQGSFDLKLANGGGTYYFLRIPFYAVRGELDTPGVHVRVGQPFMLGHKYEAGLDDSISSGAVQGAFNQFQTPVDPDADIPDDYVQMGKQHIQEVERLLLAGDD